MGTDTPRVRIAVVGCGAVTESFHLPVLAGHDDVVISALVDPNRARADKLAKLYNVPTVLASAKDVDRRVADVVLLATPAHLHASGSIDLMRRGLHVLVEKPMAFELSDASRMVAVAKENNVVLTVGLFRRLLPAIRLFRAAVDANHVGDPLRVVAEVGDEYTWRLTTLSGMRRNEAGGGILIDMGSHVIDLLLFILDGVPRLIEYADNGGEGVETDCRVDLMLHRRGASIPARIELSRTRKLSNVIVLEGSRGRLEWRFGERATILVHSQDVFVDPSSSRSRPCTIEAAWGDEPEQPGYEGFRAQIDDLLLAVRTRAAGRLSGESVLPTVDLIEQCYARRRPLDEPWVTTHLCTPASRPRAAGSSRRVLVTGASGFIGCRLSERLHFGSDWTVRALIRSPGRAVRLARMPIELAVGDLSSSDDLGRALEGCDAVVHAAVGTSWRRSERVAVNVEGTRRLVDAAMRAGVKRFVHISTIAVYGERVTGTVTEDTPLGPKKGWDYAESKLEAEQIVLHAAARGLPAIVLRPSVVYGPHNLTMVVRPLKHLLEDRLALVNCRDVPSNTIYVDNLCLGIQQALDGTPDLAGHVFLLNDDDGFTWGEYFEYFAARTGSRVQYVSKPRPPEHAAAAAPGVLKQWASSTRDLLLSSEAKALAKRIYTSDPWGTPARWAVETFPRPVARLKGWLRAEAGFVYRPNPQAQEVPFFTIDPIAARVSTEKAARMFGFRTLVPREEAMELTLEWARYARIVPQAREEMAVR
jgi:predicted dehydrogenase/nucleoside-diphosphate-sugar epimerase